MDTKTTKKHVVIVGGGFAGLGCARKLAKSDDVPVTLIDRHNYHQFQPLLNQVATAELGPGDVATSLRQSLRNHAKSRSSPAGTAASARLSCSSWQTRAPTSRSTMCLMRMPRKSSSGESSHSEIEPSELMQTSARSARRQLQGPRARQPLCGGHQLFREHRGGESLADGDGECDSCG